MPRLELLKGKSDLERELGDFSLNCAKCGLDVHLGQWSWDHARSLGAPEARAARSRKYDPDSPRYCLPPAQVARGLRG